MNKILDLCNHRVGQIKYDSSDDVIFRWHFPRGTFDKRMSVLEIATFIIPHMPSILPLLGHHPKVYLAWQHLLLRIVTWPKEALDEVVPWIRRLDYTEADEILLLHIGAKELPAGPVHFVMGGQ